ncbi:MAG: hypothetical protein ACQEXJ_20050 [Myxococcota bacterium]
MTRGAVEVRDGGGHLAHAAGPLRPGVNATAAIPEDATLEDVQRACGRLRRYDRVWARGWVVRLGAAPSRGFGGIRIRGMAPASEGDEPT